jgi:hypothetical protein
MWVLDLFSMQRLQRRELFLSVVLPLLFFLSTCTGHKETIKGTIQGTIYVIGNEPFTSLAVEDPQGKMLRLSASEEVREQLLKLQGRKVEVQYSKIDTTAEGIALSVDKFRELSP